MSQNIYEEYINSLQLLPEDREELKKKRGFTDEIIDKYKLKSLIPEDQERIINNLVVRHGEDDVRKAGLIDKSGNIAYALTQRNIIIPYQNESGEIFFLRPHKMGFTGQEIRLYGHLILKDIPASRIVITESEFKALACRQWNIPAIGLQGISTWTGDKFPELVDFLKSLQEKMPGLELVILFDTELKDSPEHEKYEEYKDSTDTKRKYPSTFWSYILCYKLSKEGLPVKIGRLPKKWCVNGKVDLDSALAMGKTQKEVFHILDSAVNHSCFLNKLEGEERDLTTREVKKYFYNFNFPLRENFNSYEWVKTVDGQESIEEISNFTLTLLNAIETQQGNTRIIQFTDSYGNKSKPFEITPEEMRHSDFITFCKRRGDYLFTGKGYQLEAVWERLFIKSSGAVIYQPDVIGRIPGDHWLFGDCVVWADGEVQELNSEKIAQKGLIGLKLSQGKKGIPRILTRDKLDIPMFIDLLQKNLGYKVFLGLGWAVATFLSSKIFKLERCFPILFLFGKRGSGKNVFGRWLCKLFGFDYEGKSFKSTAKGVERVLASYFDLPFWLNEFRNSARQDTIETLLNVYGRENYIRAEKSNDNKIVEKDIVSTLILSGQETPKDNGVFSRCIILQFSERERNDNYFEGVNRMWDILPSFALQIIRQQDTIQKEYFIIYHQIKEKLSEVTNHDPRLTTNYSVVIAGFLALAKVFNYSVDIEGFFTFVCQHCRENKITKDRESEIGEFWELVEVILSEQSILDDSYLIEDGKIYIWFSSLYKHFAEQYRKIYNSAPFKDGVIRDYLKDEPYFLALSEVKKIEGETRRCLVLDEAKFKESGYNFFTKEAS